ncbi:MAG: LysM peptidoglycan-binding domain-containing protein [Trebonia sp.]
MAPPIPGLSRPVQARKQGRTPADTAIGALAVLALAALTVGVPAGLVIAFGLPIPHSLSLSDLTSQLDLTSILKILAVVVWLAWLQLVWCVIVEIRAAVRNVGVPNRVPLAGATQPVARRLVTAALLLFSATAALSPAFAHSAAPPPRPAHSISVQAQQAETPMVAHATSAPAGHQQSADHKVYVVKPPSGRYHESLWEIAQNHLGDGRRYKEIFELNKDHIQPDGTKLTIASLIRPGWTLRMPADAHGPGIETVTQQVKVHHESAPTRTDMAAYVEAPAHAQATNQGGGVTNVRSVEMKELAAAGMLAAGVLSALGRRRRERLWQRAFGRRLPVPEGDAAAAEQALRLGADDPSVALLDNSLRHLARVNAGRRKPVPTVFAAHLSSGTLDLWVAPPDIDPPAPWTAESEGQLWRLPAAAAGMLDPGSALAPYPGLVTLGTNDTGRVMVDLEVAHGLIAVRGPGETVRSALAALAVELVTSRWSDTMKVTLVGFGEGLENIAPERTVVAASLDDVLPSLLQRSQALSAEMSLAGVDSVLTGRAFGSEAGPWEPHYLIMGTPPTEEQAAQLLELARTRQRTALGFVVAGDVPGAAWTWDISDDGRLRAPALGFELGAQLLLGAQYEAIVSLFREPRLQTGKRIAAACLAGTTFRPKNPAARLLARFANLIALFIG